MSSRSIAGRIVTRRELVQNLVFGACALALGSQRSRAAGLPRLDVNDPAAKALGYVENAAQVDLKKYPSFAKGSNCENCLKLQGAAGIAYRPCELFPGKSVAASGWCNGWAPEI
jgi:High potential iron-sulfur protein